MRNSLSIPLIVTLMRERVDQLWQGQRWAASAVSIAHGQSDLPPAQAFCRNETSPVAGFARNALTLPGVLVLERAEVPAYLVNMVSGASAIYVALEETDTTVILHGVSASPFALDADESSGNLIVDRVPIPREIIDIVRSFVDGLKPPAEKLQRETRPVG